MRHLAPLAGLFVALTGLVACSSDATTGGSSSGGPTNTGSGTSANGCACNVTNNGVSRSITCGSSACINAVTFACSSSAEVSQGSGCIEDAGATTGSPDSGSTGGSFDCYGTSCNSATSYCILSKAGSIVASESCVPLPASCSDCNCASSDTESAWEKANDNTSNCTGATLLCTQSGSAITVSCKK